VTVQTEEPDSESNPAKRIAIDLRDTVDLRHAVDLRLAIDCVE
jgi:hypothetical protein